MMRLALAAAMAVFCSVSAHADAYRPITDRGEFLSIVGNRSLQISVYGIDLRVRADGRIQGKGGGRAVEGQWRWSSGYFCRDLFWGPRDLGPNCQAVHLRGNKIRFTSDRGTGRSADFRIR